MIKILKHLEDKWFEWSREKYRLDRDAWDVCMYSWDNKQYAVSFTDILFDDASNASEIIARKIQTSPYRKNTYKIGTEAKKTRQHLAGLSNEARIKWIEEVLFIV